jgi:hypothetical protein
LDVKYYLGGGFLQALTSLLFHEGYASIEGREEITFLIGVSYMKRKKMKAFWEKKKKKTNSDKSVVRSSIRSKMEW